MRGKWVPLFQAPPPGCRPNEAHGALETRAAVRPEGDIRIGYDLPNGLTPVIGLGLRSHTHKEYDADDDLDFSRGHTDLVLAAELRYYFRPHVRGLNPYVFGEFNTTLVSFGSEDGDGDTINEGRDKFEGDELSFLQFGAGLGLEYNFAKSFALGAKWGLGLSFRNTETHDGAGDNTTNTTFGTSSAIYAAFRL